MPFCSIVETLPEDIIIVCICINLNNLREDKAGPVDSVVSRVMFQQDCVECHLGAGGCTGFCLKVNLADNMYRISVISIGTTQIFKHFMKMKYL